MGNGDIEAANVESNFDFLMNQNVYSILTTETKKPSRKNVKRLKNLYSIK